MRVSFAIATVVAIGVTALAVVTLRHVGSGADRETALEADRQAAGQASQAGAAASDAVTVES
jgi:hypothetical protein